ncbi:MAG: MoxR-like ATPase [Chthoniobacter sp.]|jgi:MoxR-like ATPase|nr:MoxR-like ATPase [Chthoniobacter sp.]
MVDAAPASGLQVASDDDVAAINQLGEVAQQMRAELARVIIGQEQVIERLLITIFARGHGLLVGVPGLAKTLLVRSLAEAMSLEFSRVQFTPDLMPSDITGTEILQEGDQPGRRRFEYVKGPIFANIVLADEINRAPPKTQSALLEAMQEHRVTAAGHLYHLPSPFFVLATQNPVEQEGTYPLPEAQLDRFMFLIHVGYPSLAEEGRIARETTGGAPAQIAKTITGEQLIAFQDLVRRVPVPDHIYDFVVDLVRRSRPDSENAPAWIKDLVTWGAGPRAVQYLILGAKARAALQGSYLARIEDVEALAEPVLVHRILTSFHAESEGISSREIIKRLVEETRADATV